MLTTDACSAANSRDPQSLRWRDAHADNGPHKTIYNRFVGCSHLSIINRIFAALAGKAGRSDTLMINATHLKAHPTSAS